jgi:hypothetical protein
MSRSFSVVSVFQFDKSVRLLISILEHDWQRKKWIDKINDADETVQSATSEEYSSSS